MVICYLLADMMGNVEATNGGGTGTNSGTAQTSDNQASAAAAAGSQASNRIPSFHPSVGLHVKTHQITQDYRISRQVLGVGINGKVVECFSRKSNDKFALKVISYS